MNTDHRLQISISSFSYKEGIPVVSQDHGGGFIFDCRGILNPGRIKQYKTQTGRDIEVIDYLEKQTHMLDFLDGIRTVVSIPIKEYLRREFDHLEIHFGCTGGQHRSVYAADALSLWIQSNFPSVQVSLHHTVQERKQWVNT